MVAKQGNHFYILKFGRFLGGYTFAPTGIGRVRDTLFYRHLAPTGLKETIY